MYIEDDGSSNSPHGLILYDVIDDMTCGGHMMQESEDGSVYEREAVDEKIKELNECIEILKSEGFEARGHAAVVSEVLRDFREATIWRKLQWSLRPNQ